jgi:hypothetical protein
MAHWSKTNEWQMEAKPTWHMGPRPKKWQIEAKPT